MTTLQEQVSQQARVKAGKLADAKATALQAYWQIIARQDKPETGDGKRLLNLLNAAGKTADDLQADVGKVAALFKARARAATEPERNRQRSAAYTAHEKAAKQLPEQIKALEANVKQLKKVRDAADGKWTKAHEAAKQSGIILAELEAAGMPTGIADTTTQGD